MTRELHVVLAARSDSEAKPGGDSIQLSSTGLALERRGVRTTIAMRPQDVSGTVDVLHLFNLDTPIEHLPWTEWASHSGVPIVLSSIHHPVESLSYYYDCDEWDEVNASLRRLRLGWDRAYGLRAWVRAITSWRHRPGSLRSILLSAPWTRMTIAQQQLITRVAHTVALTAGEEHALRKDTQAEHITVVPNAFDRPAIGTESDGSNERRGIAVVGRIEPRKNQLTVARMLARTGLPVAFIGALNFRHTKYVQEFLQVVHGHDSLEYLGTMDHGDVLRRLAVSRLCLSMSYFEVLSLVDLEAAAMGCEVVPSSAGYTSDILQVRLMWNPKADSADQRAFLDRLQMAYDAPTPSALRPDVQVTSWDDVAGSLVDVYRSTISKHSGN